MHRRAAAWGAVALTLTLAACTAPHDDTSPRPTPSPSPTQSTLVAELHLPDAPATVLDVADPSARAIAASQTFYESAPVVVVAPADDLTAQVSGAAVAVSLGAPLLLDGVADPAATRSEVTRLGAVTVLTVGGARLDDCRGSDGHRHVGQDDGRGSGARDGARRRQAHRADHRHVVGRSRAAGPSSRVRFASSRRSSSRSPVSPAPTSA
ncbi:MAG: hypothetical protein HGA44_18520 [Cellulomonadaceae bacterium]|nr:hypothetical protein [Cellulomonadaceae bacterium]